MDTEGDISVFKIIATPIAKDRVLIFQKILLHCYHLKKINWNSEE